MRNFNKKVILIFSLFFSISGITLISCDRGDVSEAQYQIEYQRDAQLNNTFTNEIIPLNLSFIVSAEALNEAVSLFSSHPTLLNLENTRDNWLNMLKVWKRLELYNLGAVEDSFIHFEINRWPTNTENIEEYINGTETLNEVFIASIGSSSKGISAMEYLLFSTEDSLAVIKSFTTQLNYERRLDYLKALSNNLITKANEIYAIWSSDKAGFTTSLESGISGSQSQLTNAIITLIEEVVISKLGNALGDNTGGIIDIEALEAFRSESSLISIQEHLIALNRCYIGSYVEESIKWGYDDYLVLIGSEVLNEDIIEAFEVCQEKIDGFSSSLSDTLTTSPDNVIALQSAFTDLLVLFKVDLANTIGTTVTINDNDGD